jgi:C1A family cysteine protease
MKSSSVGNSNPPKTRPGASRRKILRSAIALGGVTVAEIFSPGLVRFATAANLLSTPKAFDLRKVVMGSSTNNYITPVRNQDQYSPCNSCTAFAIIATIEGSFTWQKQQPITTSNPGPAYSEGQLFFCSGPPDGCVASAWYPEDALGYCVERGVTNRSNNDYVSQWCTMPSKVTDWSWQKLKGAKRLKNATEMKQWISGTAPDGPGGPVVAVMLEYDDLPGWTGGENHIYVPTSNVRIGGHTVSIVGYDDGDPNNPATNPPVWICKNSLGDKWNADPTSGVGGYFRIKQGSALSSNEPDCYIDSFDMWGVVVA